MKRTPLKRRTPIRKRNPAKGSRFPKRRDPAYCAWIRTLPCLVGMRIIDPFVLIRPCSDHVECAHVRSRVAGGDDRANTVPLCTKHHREQHRIGVGSFQLRYAVNLADTAELLASRYPGLAAHPQRDTT